MYSAQVLFKRKPNYSSRLKLFPVEKQSLFLSGATISYLTNCKFLANDTPPFYVYYFSLEDASISRI